MGAANTSALSDYLGDSVFTRCHADLLVLDVVLCRHARFFLDEVTEVAGREEYLLCEWRF